MMLFIVIFFLGISLLLYCILGGADFGAGALEFFVPRKDHEIHESLVNRALGPVWEANHIWLIILIVILFNGFPVVYSEFSIYFHIPLTMMLMGIVFRGCAFAFRHYDAVKDDTRRYYSLAFSLSSLLTPVMFGMIIGGMMLGVDPQATTYYQKYAAPWLNVFSFAIGVFVLSLFAYLAGIFLIGEAPEPRLKEYYRQQTKIWTIVMMTTGAAIFFLAGMQGHYLLPGFFRNPVSLLCFIFATFAAVCLWKILSTGKAWTLRFIAGFQIGMALLAWIAAIFPNVFFYKSAPPLSLWTAAAPPSTINILGWTLILGAVFFLPALYYLIKVFKTSAE